MVFLRRGFDYILRSVYTVHIIGIPRYTIFSPPRDEAFHVDHPVSTSAHTSKECVYVRGAKLEREFPLGPLLEPAGQQADELRLESAFQQAVVLLLVEDQEVVLHGAVGRATGPGSGEATLGWL